MQQEPPMIQHLSEARSEFSPRSYGGREERPCDGADQNRGNNAVGWF